MPWESVDKLQQALTTEVFHYATDKKKAAGRALGTLVELITLYVIRSWDLTKYTAIERPLSEYRNKAISHNVEYTLHPLLQEFPLSVGNDVRPVTYSKLKKVFAQHKIDLEKLGDVSKAKTLISTDGRLRNACTLANNVEQFTVANVINYLKEHVELNISVLHDKPFAMFECKRVGVEEGARKGPQTIEKAKQGAYVARTVSSMQKFRFSDGRMGGVIEKPDGSLYGKDYFELLTEIVDAKEPSMLIDFILTVGVVSNHGNWFTAETQNKELRVLAQSYDWLIFLTDSGLSEFVEDVLINPSKRYEVVRKAFRDTYDGQRSGTRFTKVQIDVEADRALREYFDQNKKRIDGWFNVISPEKRTLKELRRELHELANKDWKEILK